jgi:Holliday junction resolvase
MAAESKLQKKIINDLKKKGWIPLKIILCNLPGFNDIIAYRNKVSVFVEAKSPGKKAEPLQVYRHDILKKQGFTVITVDSWEEYEKHRNIFL